MTLALLSRATGNCFSPDKALSQTSNTTLRFILNWWKKKIELYALLEYSVREKSVLWEWLWLWNKFSFSFFTVTRHYIPSCCPVSTAACNFCFSKIWKVLLIYSDNRAAFCWYFKFIRPIQFPLFSDPICSTLIFCFYQWC